MEDSHLVNRMYEFIKKEREKNDDVLDSASNELYEANKTINETLKTIIGEVDENGLDEHEVIEGEREEEE